MPELNPKQQFQANEEMAKAFRSIVFQPAFQLAATQALAEFALTSKPTTEQLDGARIFLRVFLNLAEQATAMPEFPVKRLTPPISGKRPQPQSKPSEPIK